MATKKTSVKEAPYDHRGSLLHYQSKESTTWYRGVVPQPGQPGYVEWRSNEPFTAMLTLSGMESGYSAKYVIWKNAEGQSFPMFVTDLMDLIRRWSGTLDAGTLTARWMVAKRGQNYGIRLAKEDE